MGIVHESVGEIQKEAHMAAIEPVMPGDGALAPAAGVTETQAPVTTTANPTVTDGAQPPTTQQTAVVDRPRQAGRVGDAAPGEVGAKEVRTTTFVRFSAHGRRLGGLALLVLGAWGAIVPFIGPDFGLAPYGSHSGSVSTPVLVLSVLPGVVAFIAGAVLAAGATRGRVTGALAAILAAAAGIWFVVGRISWPLVRPLFGAANLPSGADPGMVNVLGAFLGVGVAVALAAGIALASALRPHRRIIEEDTEEI